MNLPHVLAECTRVPELWPLTAVAAYVAGRPIRGEFVEVESGRKHNRPQLAAALALWQKCRAVLVIAKLDRLARSVAFICNLMAALALAKARGTLLGNPRLNMVAVHAVASGNAARFRAAIKPQIQALKAKGGSLRRIAAELDAGGISGPRGGSWHAASVRSMIVYSRDAGVS